MPTIPLDDGSLWYDVTGDGPPLVFLHGGWLDADAWRAQVDRFADDYRVVTVDFRGHGRSGATDARRYTVDTFVDDLELVLDELDVERPILCGLSLGAMTAQAYLDRHPDDVAAAIFPGPVRTMPPFELPRQFKATFSPMPAVAGSASTFGTVATFRSLLAGIRATTGGPWLSVDRSVRREVVDDVGDISPAEYRKIFGAIYGFEPPDLSGVDVPALVVHGDHESPLVVRQGRELARELGDARVEEIADAGHLVNQDAPAAFNDAAASFLADLDLPAARAATPDAV